MEDVNALKNIIEQLKTENNSLSKEKEDLVADRKQLNSELVWVEKSNKALQELNQELEIKNDALSKDKKELIKSITELEKEKDWFKTLVERIVDSKNKNIANKVIKNTFQPPILKEDFISIMEFCAEQTDYIFEAEKYIGYEGVLENYVDTVDFIVTLVNKLMTQEFFGEMDWIPFFTHELNYLKDYTEDCVFDDNGNIDVSSWDKVYDFVVNEMNLMRTNKENETIGAKTKYEG